MLNFRFSLKNTKMTAVSFKFFLKPSQESAACNRIPPGSDTRSLTICFNECLTLRATYSRAIFFFPSLATTIDGRRNRESKDDLMACRFAWPFRQMEDFTCLISKNFKSLKILNSAWCEMPLIYSKRLKNHMKFTILVLQRSFFASYPKEAHAGVERITSVLSSWNF